MSLRLCPRCNAPAMNFGAFLLRGISNPYYKCGQCGTGWRRETGLRVLLPNVVIAGVLYAALRSPWFPQEIRNPAAVVVVALAAACIMGFATFRIARWLPRDATTRRARA